MQKRPLRKHRRVSVKRRQKLVLDLPIAAARADDLAFGECCQMPQNRRAYHALCFSAFVARPKRNSRTSRSQCPQNVALAGIKFHSQNASCKTIRQCCRPYLVRDFLHTRVVDQGCRLAGQQWLKWIEHQQAQQACRKRSEVEPPAYRAAAVPSSPANGLFSGRAWIQDTPQPPYETRCCLLVGPKDYRIDQA